MKFELEPYNRNVPDGDLIADIQRVACELQVPTVTMEQYATGGRFGATTVCKRFGSWNFALERAGIAVGKRWRIPDETLFENLEGIWRHLGRQPRRSDLDVVTTNVSKSVYEQRFGSWRQALKAFVDWVNTDEGAEVIPAESIPSTHKTGRQPSLRLRFRVMRRDRFCCRHCGRSPSSTPSLELHVDHIVAWSKCGETVLENLQTLCDDCNLGKSNLAEVGT
jgi:hypothetical protein